MSPSRKQKHYTVVPAAAPELTGVGDSCAEAKAGEHEVQHGNVVDERNVHEQDGERDHGVHHHHIALRRGRVDLRREHRAKDGARATSKEHGPDGRGGSAAVNSDLIERGANSREHHTADAHGHHVGCAKEATDFVHLELRGWRVHEGGEWTSLQGSG